MSRKNKAKRERRLANQLLQPEEIPDFYLDVTKASMLHKCKERGLNRLWQFVKDLPNTQYEALWRFITFMVCLPTKDMTARNFEDGETWKFLAEMDKNLLSNASAYTLKKRIREIQLVTKH